MRGKLVDLAVGLIIGVAFGASIGQTDAARFEALQVAAASLARRPQVTKREGRRRVGALLLGLGLSACARSDSDGRPDREIAFQCPGDRQFVAVFEPDIDSVVISLRDERTRLPRVPTASGAKYSNGSTTFWSKGDQASLERPGEAWRDCLGTTIWPPDDGT